MIKFNLSLRSDKTDDYANYALRQARIDKGYTGKQVAERVGVSIPSYFFYENVRAFPSPQTAMKIACALGKSVDELFPEKLRNLTAEIRAERDKKSNSIESFVYLSDVPEIDLVSADDPVRTVQMNFFREILGIVLRTLSYREREVLKLRYGIYSGFCHTLEQTGLVLRCSGERIRQIEAKALNKLRYPLRSRLLEDFFFD